MNKFYAYKWIRPSCPQITKTVGGLIPLCNHTPCCLTNYNSLDFGASSILNSLQCTCLPLGVVLHPKEMGEHNVSPSQDKTTD